MIYETHIRDFIAKHDYQTMIDTISYFKTLGINAIELMPINEFEGNESWGYNPAMYFAPDKYYGTKGKLKAFIDVCHQNGIAVIMDIVLNHAFGQNPHVRMYWDAANNKPSADNPWFNQQSPNSSYSWGYDFNHESKDCQNFVDTVNAYWLSEYKFDGFRFDFTKGFTNKGGDGWAYDESRITILKRMADKIWETAPDAYVILEHFADNREEKKLANHGMLIWGNLNHSYLQASMGYNNESDFSWVSAKKRGWDNPNVVGFMESHDEERMMFKNLEYGNVSGEYSVKDLPTALNRAKLASVFFFTIPGPKMIWQFQELGYEISIDEPCRVCNKPIHWEYLNDENRYGLYLFFKKMIEMKIENPIFETDDFSIYANSSIKQIVLRSENENMLIVGNFGVTEKSAAAKFPSTGLWQDIFTETVINVSDISQELTLAPGEYRIYTDSVSGGAEEFPTGYKVYPNPAEDFIRITNILVTGKVTISDLYGKQVFTATAAPAELTEIHISTLRRGIYFLKYDNGIDAPTVSKFLKMK